MLGEGHDPTISPNGKQLLHRRCRWRGERLHSGLDGNNKPESQGDQQGGSHLPNWSPDAKEMFISFQWEMLLSFF